MEVLYLEQYYNLFEDSPHYELDREILKEKDRYILIIHKLITKRMSAVNQVYDIFPGQPVFNEVTGELTLNHSYEKDLKGNNDSHSVILHMPEDPKFAGRYRWFTMDAMQPIIKSPDYKPANFDDLAYHASRPVYHSVSDVKVNRRLSVGDFVLLESKWGRTVSICDMITCDRKEVRFHNVQSRNCDYRFTSATFSQSGIIWKHDGDEVAVVDNLGDIQYRPLTISSDWKDSI